MSKKLRVAWFSPFAGDNPRIRSSRAAYFSRVVVPLLRERFEIELFHDSHLRVEGFTCSHFLSAWKRHAANPFDIFVYQLEDGRHCGFSRIQLALQPGVVFFHDFFLTDDGPEPMLNSPYSAILRRFHDQQVRWPYYGEEFLRERPQAIREANFALVPVFLHEKDARECENLRGQLFPLTEARPEFIPYPAVTVSRPPSPGALFTLGFCGSARIEDRAQVIGQAFHRLPELRTRVRLLWLVEGAAEEGEARMLMGEYGLTEHLSFVHSRSPEAWANLCAEIDAGCHLHFSVFGSASPYTEISLAAGKPVIISDFGGARYVPRSLAVRIQPGETESMELSQVLLALATGRVEFEPDMAKAYASEKHHPKVVAANVERVLIHGIEVNRAFSPKWSAFQADARGTVLRAAGLSNTGPWFDSFPQSVEGILHG